MIERRKESRFGLSVPVQASGIDGDGEPFEIEVMASSLSRSGALLTGLEVGLRCGDMLVVDYEGRRAHFRIVWFLNLGPRLGQKWRYTNPIVSPACGRTRCRPNRRWPAQLPKPNDDHH